MKFFIIVILVVIFFVQFIVFLIKWDDWVYGRVVFEDVLIYFCYVGSGFFLFFIYGNFQYSLMWQWIGLVIVEFFIVIVLDNCGVGDLFILLDGNYSVIVSVVDFKGVFDFFNIIEIYVFFYDKGVGMVVVFVI